MANQDNQSASVIAVIDYSNTFVSGTQTNGQVYIRLMDAATRQPVNGNNVPVTYQITNNGVTATLTANISGQSIPIDTGTIRDTNPAHPVQKSYAIISLGVVPAAPPAYIPAEASDLVINYITVDRPESAPGARDGQITVNASSGRNPVQYSINGGNYQSSPVFGGLPGGLVNVYVMDEGGFTSQGSTQVNTLSNLLASDPSVTLIDGNISRWSAAFNPVVFTYQRKDFGIISTSADSETGYTLIQINTSLVNPFTAAYVLAAGDKVYADTALYKGV